MERIKESNEKRKGKRKGKKKPKHDCMLEKIERKFTNLARLNKVFFSSINTVRWMKADGQ